MTQLTTNEHSIPKERAENKYLPNYVSQDIYIRYVNSEFTVTFEVPPQAIEQIIIKLCNILIINERMLNINTNHKN